MNQLGNTNQTSYINTTTSQCDCNDCNELQSAADTVTLQCECDELEGAAVLLSTPTKVVVERDCECGCNESIDAKYTHSAYISAGSTAYTIIQKIKYYIESAVSSLQSLIVNCKSAILSVVAKEENATSNKQEILQAIGTIQIDTSNIAKQGSNKNISLTSLYDYVTDEATETEIREMFE